MPEKFRTNLNCGKCRKRIRLLFELDRWVKYDGHGKVHRCRKDLPRSKQEPKVAQEVPDAEC